MNSKERQSHLFFRGSNQVPVRRSLLLMWLKIGGAFIWTYMDAMFHNFLKRHLKKKELGKRGKT